MPGTTQKLLHGSYYHLYNRGINSCNLFNEVDNYEYFLHLYDKYISDYADTFAWVLMPNHFHFVIRIKEKSELVNPDLGLIKQPHQHFSNLFNAYTKAFNERFSRHGSLFERPFKRKLIDNERYFRQLIMYVHNNPVHHRFCGHTIEYPWSSYITCISVKKTKLKRETTIGWFQNINAFISSHNQNVDISEIDQWLGLNSSESTY